MKTFAIAVAGIAFIVVLSLVLLLLGGNVADVMFSILSGSGATSLAALLALSKGVPSHKVMWMVFLSIVSAASAWLTGLLLLKVTTVNLYSTTALAFDLAVGLVGSIAMSAYLLEKHMNRVP